MIFALDDKMSMSRVRPISKPEPIPIDSYNGEYITANHLTRQFLFMYVYMDACTEVLTKHGYSLPNPTEMCTVPAGAELARPYDIYMPIFFGSKTEFSVPMTRMFNGDIIDVSNFLSDFYEQTGDNIGQRLYAGMMVLDIVCYGCGFAGVDNGVLISYDEIGNYIERAVNFWTREYRNPGEASDSSDSSADITNMQLSITAIPICVDPFCRIDWDQDSDTPTKKMLRMEAAKCPRACMAASICNLTAFIGGYTDPDTDLESSIARARELYAIHFLDVFQPAAAYDEHIAQIYESTSDE